MKPRYYLITGLYCAALFWLSSQPDPPGPDLTAPGSDKVAHALVYAGLAAILAFGIRRSNTAVRPWVQYGVPAFFAAAYGLSDEVHQLFVPHRDFDPFDIAADALGAVLMGAILYQWWRRQDQETYCRGDG